MQSICETSTCHRSTLPVIVEALPPRPIDQADTIIPIITRRALGMQEVQALLFRLTGSRWPDFGDLGFKDALTVDEESFDRSRGAFLLLMVIDDHAAKPFGGVENLGLPGHRH